jgi:hypothetical protein
MLTFFEASDLLLTARSIGRGKPLCNNTRLKYYRVGSEIYFYIVLHQTTIIKIHTNGLYILNTGGYYTNTTKNLINKYSPACITQENYEWFLHHYNYSTGLEEKIKFFDGIVVDKRGKPIIHNRFCDKKTYKQQINIILDEIDKII